MKLSVIVPVYNMAADKKLEYCMDSLVNQTIADYEIIAVDDASKDNSVEILKEYERRYPDKVRVICHEVNKRQGGAKNTGLAAAKGEWIGFIDSDDWVTPDYYEKLLGKAGETGADMVGCDYNLVYEHTMTTGEVIRNNTSDQTGILDEEKHKKLLMRSGSMVIKIYRHDVIRENGLCFPEGIFYEDNCAGPVWSLYFHHFEKVEEPNYFYYQHQVSTVHHVTEEKCRDRMKAAVLLYEECERRGFLEKYHREIEYRFTELYYVNTLFSYLSGVRKAKLSFVKELRRGVRERFPDFEQNPYYKEETGKEERELIALQGKSAAAFLGYYKLKQAVRSMGKGFVILLLAELVLLLLGAAGLFGKGNVYTFENTAAVVYENAAEGENKVEFQNISLPAGTYQIRLRYRTDTDSMNFCGISDKSVPEQKLRTNGVLLYSGRNMTDYELWLLQGTSQMTVYVQYGGEGTVEAAGLEIVETKAGNRILLFFMVCLFAAVDAGFVYWKRDKRGEISVKQKNIFFFLGLTILFASLPLFTNAMISAGDLGYHLMRVEGIRDGLRSGQFPVRISPNWQQGYGYASPIFYGETILYLAGLLRLLGFSILTSYRIFMFILTVATVLISYFCFKRIFQDGYTGVFCSSLYTLSVYRIFKTYLTGSWGETLGILLLPLLVYGFYRVFTQDENPKDENPQDENPQDKKTYRRSWIPLTIGFSLLVQSHLLTGEMVGFFTILLCIIMIKRVFRKETFLVLAKTVIYSILLSAWFLIPFADYMLTGDFVIHNVSARTIQDRGLYIAHLFYAFFRAGSGVFFQENGMADTQPMGVGIVLIAALLLWFLMRFHGKTEGLTAKETGFGRIVCWFGILSMIMSLSIFPWDKIQSLGGIAASLVSSIQFPNRFLTISNVCLVSLAGVVAKYVFVSGRKQIKLLFAGGMVGLLSIGSLLLMNDLMNRADTFKAYGTESTGTGYISGAEYLPYGADASAFMWHDPVGTEGVTVQNYLRRELGGEADITNMQESVGNVAFSLLYYKGYHAFDTVTGEELNCYAGSNFEVTVDVPAGYSGRISVDFESPWYWRAGEIISFLTLLAMLLSAWGLKRREGPCNEK